jgi:hypothetical protein
MRAPERYSPDWVTARILDGRQRFDEDFAPLLPARLIFAAVALLALGMLSLAPGLNHFWLYFAATFIIASSLTVVGARMARNVWFYTMLWAALVGAYSYMAGSPLYFALAFLMYGLLWLTFRRMQNSLPFYKIAAALAVAVGYYLVLSFLIEGPWHFGYLQLLRPQRVLFLILLSLLSALPGQVRENNRRAFFQIFFPLNLVYQIPFTLEHWKVSPHIRRQRVRGLWDISVAGFYFYLFYFTSQGVLMPKTLPDYLHAGLFTYIETYLLSAASICLPVGVERIMGFNFEDAFVVPLLASSPFERWRRWNTYYYRFYSVVIFMPLARKMKMLFLPIMATFAAAIVFHSFTRNLAELAYGHTQALAMGVVWFFLAHGLAVYVSIKWRFKIYDGTKLIGWLGVLATWVMMIGIHCLNRWGEN